MVKHYYVVASAILFIAVGGALVSCSSDEPQIPETNPVNPEPKPEPEEEKVTLHVTYYPIGKTKYKELVKSSRGLAYRPSKGGLGHVITVGDTYSVYEEGTTNKVGQVTYTDDSKDYLEGDIVVKKFEGSKKVYLALDEGAADNIQWDGKVFTFKNAYGIGTYKGIIGEGTNKFVISTHTGEGPQEYYQLGEGLLTQADNKIQGYAQTCAPVVNVVVPENAVTQINKVVKEKGYTQLTLKVQTDEKVLTSWTYNPSDYAYTFTPSDTNIRTIVYDAAAKELQSNKEVRLYFTMEPGMWTNPIIKLYGGTSSNGEMQELGTVKIDENYVKKEYIAADLYNKDTAQPYQLPVNYAAIYGNLELK